MFAALLPTRSVTATAGDGTASCHYYTSQRTLPIITPPPFIVSPFIATVMQYGDNSFHNKINFKNKDKSIIKKEDNATYSSNELTSLFSLSKKIFHNYNLIVKNILVNNGNGLIKDIEIKSKESDKLYIKEHNNKNEEEPIIGRSFMKAPFWQQCNTEYLSDVLRRVFADLSVP